MTLGSWIWWSQAVLSGLSLAIRRPWTMFLAARRYRDDVQAHPLFREANTVITAGWTAYFVLAGAVAAVAPAWTSALLALATPALAWVSFQVGERYPVWRLGAPPGGGLDMATDRQRELRGLVAGQSDDAILAMAEGGGGVENVLDETFAGMGDALDPDVAQDCVIGYELAGPDGTYSYRVEVKGSTVAATRQAPDDARTVLQLSIPDYLRLITGLLDGTQAFMSGQLKIRGDVMFATQVQRMFRTA